jgi:hypothetical protein
MKRTGLFLCMLTVGLSAAPDTVYLKVGDNFMNAVNANPGRTVFVIKAGVHRGQSIVPPKTGNAFIGEKGAVMNGSILLANWTKQGNYWTHTGIAQRPEFVGGASRCGSRTEFATTQEPDADSMACLYDEDIYIDNKPLFRTAVLSKLQPGWFYVNYSTGTAYILDDPSGKTVEMGVPNLRFAIGSLWDNDPTTAPDSVVIRNLTIEKYSNNANSGTVGGVRTGKHWVVEDCEVRLNHGGGVHLRGGGFTVRNNKINWNGQMGLCGLNSHAKGGLVEGNEIAYNNYASHSWGWGGGGTKFVGMSRGRCNSSGQPCP